MLRKKTIRVKQNQNQSSKIHYKLIFLKIIQHRKMVTIKKTIAAF